MTNRTKIEKERINAERSKVLALARECGVRCIAEYEAPNSYMLTFATAKGCVLVQCWNVGGNTHYSEGGGKWDDLAADLAQEAA